MERRFPSRRLRALNRMLRLVAKPRLERTPTPGIARAEFERVARHVFRSPPFLLRQVSPTAGNSPRIHMVSARAPGRIRHPGVILYAHGGAYVAGSPATHEGLAGRLSALTGMDVALPAYRRAPEHPAPAAFDDMLRAHAALRAQGIRPSRIALAGDSAGGGLALALLAELCREDMRPFAVAVFSPWADLGLGSASLKTNAAADPLLPVSRIGEVVGYVLGEGREALSADDPRVSPVNADFETPPPALIQVGDTEILRDDAMRMAARLRRGGGHAHLSQWAEAPHVWPLFDGYLPEARAALREAADFLLESWAEPKA